MITGLMTTWKNSKLKKLLLSLRLELLKKKSNKSRRLKKLKNRSLKQSSNRNSRGLKT